MRFLLPGSFLIGAMQFCAPPTSALSDKDILSFAFSESEAGEEVSKHSAARVVFKRRFAESDDSFAGYWISVVQAGGRDRLLVLGPRAESTEAKSARQSEPEQFERGHRDWKALLALDFSAPLRPTQGRGELPAGLSSRRELYASDSADDFAALRRLAIVAQGDGRSRVVPTLYIEFARSDGPGFFLYTRRGGSMALQRSFDSQLRPPPGNAFLYFNGVETQACVEESGVCPAFALKSSAEQDRDADKTPCAGSRLRFWNLAPRPRAFQARIAVFRRSGEAEDFVGEEIGEISGGESCASRGERDGRDGRELVCRIAAGPTAEFCLRAGSSPAALDPSGILRLNVASGASGGAVRVLPPSPSLRRSDSGAYLLPIATLLE